MIIVPFGNRGFWSGSEITAPPVRISCSGLLPMGITCDEPLPDATVSSPAEIKVRQIPVREYETGFAFVNDEPALVGLLCGRDKAWALMLTPAAFEEILETGREVNEKGFFSSCQRRMERIQKEQATMYGVMASLPPETLKLVMAKGQEMMLNQSHSPTLLPGFVPSPAR